MFINKFKLVILISILILIGILIYMFFRNNNTELDDKFTICVKTIYRHKAIGKLALEMRKLFPTTTIIIADDSDDEYKKLNIKSINEASPNDKNIIYIPLPYDSGLSYGRNKCVERVKTPYTLILDDTRVLTSKNDLYNSIRYLDKNPQYDMITGKISNRDDNGIHSHYSFTFDKIYDENNNIITDNKNILMDKISKHSPLKIIAIDSLKNKDGYYKTDIGHNHFVSRTNTLRNNKWDNTLKISEHEDYFLRLWINNINVLYNENLLFNQLGEEYRHYDKNGKDLRDRSTSLNYIDFIYNDNKIN
jgi:hypothetical protein